MIHDSYYLCFETLWISINPTLLSMQPVMCHREEVCRVTHCFDANAHVFRSRDRQLSFMQTIQHLKVPVMMDELNMKSKNTSGK